MKFFNLNFKKNNEPRLESLRPPLFNVDLYWLLTMGATLLIVVATTTIGLKLFFNEYFENYKKGNTGDQFGELINIQRLERAIDKRNQFMNKPASIPKDPSI